MRAAVVMLRLPGSHSLLACDLAIVHSQHFTSLLSYEMEILLQGVRVNAHEVP